LIIERDGYLTELSLLSNSSFSSLGSRFVLLQESFGDKDVVGSRDVTKRSTRLGKERFYNNKIRSKAMTHRRCI
jgi:hypothetical protein